MEQSWYSYYSHSVSSIPRTTQYVVSRFSRYLLQRSDNLVIMVDSSYMAAAIGRQQPMLDWQMPRPRDMIPASYAANYGYIAPPPASQAYIRPHQRRANGQPRQQQASLFPFNNSPSFGPANVAPPQPANEPEVLILDRLPQELGTAANHVIKTLPSAVLSPDDEKPDCVVCMDELGVENKISKLPCGHFFHSNCILLWLNINNICPLCRFKL